MNKIVLSKVHDFDLVIDAVLGGLESVGSKRIYSVTYNKWFVWCEGLGLNPFEMNSINVGEFLKAQNCTKETRAHYLSHIRKMVEYLAIHFVDFTTLYNDLKFLKVPSEGAGGKERNLSALRPDQVYKLLTAWNKDTNTHSRNHAMIALSLATGGRRSEIVALQWADVNLSDGTAFIRHGKGDKARNVAIVGDFAIDALEAWQKRQGSGWQYIFVPINKKGTLVEDKPIDSTTLYKVFRKTRTLTGVDFTPHDLRRTLATELFVEGAMTSDVQAQLGHSDSSTTNRYALAGDATVRRKRFKTRWAK